MVDPRAYLLTKANNTLETYYKNIASKTVSNKFSLRVTILLETASLEESLKIDNSLRCSKDTYLMQSMKRIEINF